MNAIIWGVHGQDGYYLSELLFNKGIDVIGVSRSDKTTFIDIRNYDAVKNLINKHKPGFVFHLAANSTTQHNAWKENHETISTGTLHILEAVKETSPATKVFLSGSGLQFENKGLPIKETDPFDASSIYAVSRIHTTYAARYYRKLGLKVYMGYFFNHDSPRRSERHINQKIVATAKRIAEGSTERLKIGNLSVRKEFGFAGDVSYAIWTLVQQDTVFETVIGTGVAYSIKEWVQIAFLLHGLDWKEHVTEEQGFTPEYNILVADPKTIFSLGWKPKTDIKNLAKLMAGV